MTHKFVIELVDDCKGYEQDVDYLERIYGAELIKEHDEEIYNKAIDDFVKFANTMPTVETDDGEIRPMWLEEMAEQLKAGGNIELSEHSKSKGNRKGK